MRLSFLAALLVLGSACGSSPVIGTPLTNECSEASRPFCIICCTDQGTEAQCTDEGWKCPAPTVDSKLCELRNCAPPPSSRALCVDRDAGVCLGCGANETCLTSLGCTSRADGGMSCADLDGGVGDDRCHAHCDFFDQCAAGESCATVTNAGCGINSSQDRLCTF